MATSRRGKSTVVQAFPEEDLVSWQQKLRNASREVVVLLSGVLEAATLHIQLGTLKKLGTCVQELLSDANALRDIIFVLVEMHAACISRHPVQRSIASILQGLPQSLHACAEDYVAATLQKVLCGKWLAEHMRNIQYLDVVVENFKIGEAALQRMLPLAMEYCVSTVDSSCSQMKRHNANVLTAVLKTTANLLQKFPAIVYQMLHMEEPNSVTQEGDGCSSMLVWPQLICGRSTYDKTQWVKEQLANVRNSCESVLLKAASVPHDCTVSAAMLSVVLLLHGAVNADVDDRICQFSQQWLSEGSSLEHFGRLAVTYALLAKLPTLKLLMISFRGQPLLVALFSILCQLFNSFTETGHRYIASCTLSLWTSVARDCVKDVSPTSPLYKSLLPSGGIMQSLLQYVWSLWEDPVDGIRHQCKDMFKNITETYRQLQSEGSEDFLFSLVETLLALETPTRGKFILLSSLSQYVQVDRILQACPGLPEEILAVMGHQALACHAGDLWSMLTGLHWKLCVSKDTWYKTWVDVMIRRMCEALPLARQHMVQHCIPSLFHCDGECMQYINQHLQSERMASVSAESKLITQLACLRCAKTECKQFSTNVSFSEILNSAMHCADEQIRLSALGLVCESHRTTEPLDPSCVHLVLQFIELNANSQSPGFRYAAINSLKKLLIRIRDSSYALVKQHQKGHCETPKTYILSMQEFLQLLLNQQFEVLHPLSSFQRRNFALLVLQLLSTIFESHLADTTVHPIFDFNTALSEVQAKSLLHGLRDSYDANRVLYFKLLQKIPAEKLGLMDQLFLKHLAAMFFHLIGSPKAVESASATFFLKLFLQKVCFEFNGHLKTVKKDAFGGEENDEADPDTVSSLVPCKYPQWSTIHILCGVLLQHTHIAEHDLLQASMVAPMYGVVQCIRVSFEEAITLSPTSNVIGQFRSSVSEVVTLCSRVVKLVSPVVCNSSPEGFLPEAKNLEVYGRSKPLDRTLATTGNAQSLLLCCWHSMKEISLTLGYIVEHVPVQEDHGETGVLTLEQLDVIANIFINQLTEARHRGAFEMAYTGFSKLCHCLWTSSYAELHQKPSVWVQELLDSLQSTSLTTLLSFTRRSAGLPFYMQAILTAEPHHTGRCCLKNTMRTLLKIARNCNILPQVGNSSNVEMATTYPDTQQPLPEVVHALNILRALYRDTRLGDSIVPFVAEGVMIAVEGFSSTLWPIRNSSTLLFSALMARIFGAQRVADQHSMENKMTAKDFFTRFPSLHGFLLEQLNNAGEMLERQDGNILCPSLFPVLLLLSHLYPSALDEENSTVSLKPFLPHLMRCVSCPVWKTRVLISHAAVSTVSAQNVPLLIEEIVKKITPHNHNELHGLLLIVYRLIVDHSGLLDVPHSSDSAMSIGHWLLELLLTKPCFSMNSCSVTATLYLELATKLLEHLFCKKDTCRLSENAVGGLTKLAQSAQRFLFAKQGRSTTFPDDEFLVAQCHFLLLVAQYSERHLPPEYQWPHATIIIPQSLQHTCQTVQLVALEYLAHNPSAVDEVALQAVIDIVLHDDTDCDQDVLAKAFCCLTTAATLPGAADPHDSECSTLKKVLDKAVDLSHLKYIRLVLKLALIRYVPAALSSKFSLTTQYLTQWLSVLEESSSPMHSVELRIEVARSLLQLWNVVRESLDVDMYCKLVVELLQDADSDVREEMAVSVAAIIAQTNPQCGSSLQNPTAYSALLTFLGSLFSLFPRHKAQCFSILLDLISLDIELPSEGSTNPLFDEDPINNYKEEARLVQITGRCLTVFVKVHHAEVADQLQQLCERVALVLQLHQQELLGCSMKLWEQPRQVLLLYKLLILRMVLLSAPFNSPFMADINMSIQQLKEADQTLMFQPLLSNIL